MEYVEIGTGSGLRVSRVCMGTMEFAAFPGFVAPPQETINLTVGAALSAGVNFFDAAEAYGKDRAAERALGVALKANAVKRSDVIIATKFGRHKPLWETDSPTGDQTLYSSTDVQAAIDASLEALDMEYVDLLQIHWPGNIGLKGDEVFMESHPNLQENVRAVASTLREAQSSGKVRHVGLCNFGESDLAAWLSAGGPRPVSNQLPYNLLWRVGERGALPSCTKAGLSVLPYSPLQQGLLSGRVFTAEDLAEDRRRIRLFGPSASPKAAHKDLVANAAEEVVFGDNGVLAALHSLCAAHPTSTKLPALALAWLLSRPGVSCVIFGASTPDQVRRNAQLPDVPADLLEQATKVTEKLKWTLGCCLDQYAAESRIHGNGEHAEDASKKRKAEDALVK